MGTVHKIRAKSQLGQFVIRFDDLCPEMNWYIWNQIEEILIMSDIKPIIAVVPNNMDDKLKWESNKENFWTRIKEYSDLGWMIAIHGYDHVYINHKSGIIGISNNSEFVSLKREEQKIKLEKGIDIFKSHGIKVNCFVAPSHSFDNNTLKTLKELNINIISDGHLKYPYEYKGLLWLPCQIWDRITECSGGFYTVCIHFNNWKKDDIDYFKKSIDLYRNAIINPTDVTADNVLGIMGIIESTLISYKYKAKNGLKALLTYFK